MGDWKSRGEEEGKLYSMVVNENRVGLWWGDKVIGWREGRVLGEIMGGKGVLGWMMRGGKVRVYVGKGGILEGFMGDVVD